MPAIHTNMCLSMYYTVHKNIVCSMWHVSILFGTVYCNRIPLLKSSHKSY
uniref:Uncharacterized protein n=1 Tax=Anguilla anguilla TaxID=7936 RepID=A0A0E9XPT2_ANGAN